ncbi:MAG: DUF2493 domain-containing protein [Deltaproteobacteria bacterium]|jgi:hypothetical protein|nr:DUF2493 domain-containing protein [Deltaproteobacteria bacterium]
MDESGILNQVTEIVSGLAKGVDTLAIEYANKRGIGLKMFPADWKRFGRSAGPRRNEEMARYADYGVAVWDGLSHGTKHMIRLMEGRCHVYIVGQR